MKKDDLQYDEDAREEAIQAALKKYDKYKNQCDKDDYIVVFNIDEPSYRKRLYLYDLKAQKVIRHHHVSHGVNSSDPKDRAYAKYFSNEQGSHKSSIGAMVTGSTYRGKHGRSLKLYGLEAKNSNVERRYIVIHRAYYVTNNYIMDRGRAGQSHGCPAIDPLICDSLISMIKGGTFFYVYHKTKKKQ